MCGRFIDPNLRGTEFEMSEIRIDPIPRRFNVKPTQEVYVWQGGAITFARWGLIPHWHKGELKEWRASTINARIEDAAKKPTYRGPWRHGRCLVPAGGYYEWTGERGAKQPHVFLPAGNEETLWFAGLVSTWRDMLTCTILTRAANESAAPIHDRMPVILSTQERETWLGGADDTNLGESYQVRHHPVRPFGIRDDGEELIEPIEGRM